MNTSAANIRYSNFTIQDIHKMFEDIKNITNIEEIIEMCNNTEKGLKEMLNVSSDTTLCITVISTQNICGFKFIEFTTKFTNFDTYNSICYEPDFFNGKVEPSKMNCSAIKNMTNNQKKIVEYLREKYIELITKASNQMNIMNNYSDLNKYNCLFNYYVNKINFMLSQWGEILETHHLENNPSYQEQKKRIMNMEMKRVIPIFIVGGILSIPISIISYLTFFCWAPCYVASKISSLDDEIEKKRLEQIKDKQKYWVE